MICTRAYHKAERMVRRNIEVSREQNNSPVWRMSSFLREVRLLSENSTYAG